jgi:hypothetical protein
MSDKIIKQILARDPEEKEFHQAVPGKNPGTRTPDYVPGSLDG